MISWFFIVVLLYSIGVFEIFFFFQAEDGIRDLVRSRGLGDVYKRQFLMSIGFISTIWREMIIKKQVAGFSKRVKKEGLQLSLIHI